VAWLTSQDRQIQIGQIIHDYARRIAREVDEAQLAKDKAILDQKGLCHNCGWPLDNSYPHPAAHAVRW